MWVITCLALRRDLDLYAVPGALDQARALRVRAHLERCCGCRRRLRRVIDETRLALELAAAGREVTASEDARLLALVRDLASRCPRR